MTTAHKVRLNTPIILLSTSIFTNTKKLEFPFSDILYTITTLHWKNIFCWHCLWTDYSNTKSMSWISGKKALTQSFFRDLNAISFVSGSQIVKYDKFYLIADGHRIKVVESLIANQRHSFRIRTSFAFKSEHKDKLKIRIKKIFKGKENSVFVFLENSEIFGSFYELNLEILDRVKMFPFIKGESEAANFRVHERERRSDQNRASRLPRKNSE